MAEKIPFMKLSGAGNDFVIIDNRDGVVQYENTDFVEKVCQRRMSAGADGVLLVEDTDKADFRMRYFNAEWRRGGDLRKWCALYLKVRLYQRYRFGSGCPSRRKPESTNQKLLALMLRSG